MSLKFLFASVRFQWPILLNSVVYIYFRVFINLRYKYAVLGTHSLESVVGFDNLFYSGLCVSVCVSCTW